MPIALVLLGVQGSGKGTVGDKFILEGWSRIIMSEALKKKKDKDPVFYKKFFSSQKNHIDTGHLQSDEAVRICFVDEMRIHRGNNIVLDGCVRTVPQAEDVFEILNDLSYCVVCVRLKCLKNTSIERIKFRAAQAKLRGEPVRPDDSSSEAITRRLDEFYARIDSICKTIRSSPIGLPIYEVSADRPKDEVIADVEVVIKKSLSVCAR